MWKTLNPIWQTLILILLIAGAVPTIYFCGYKSSAKKAEAEKAEVIATYQASALVAEQLYEDDYLNPYGLGDLGLVFWLVTFKRGGMKFWVSFTEKYGAPWLIGKEPRSNTHSDTEKLLDALEALISNSVGTIPNDSSVEIHEASGKSSSVARRNRRQYSRPLGRAVPEYG